MSFGGMIDRSALRYTSHKSHRFGCLRRHKSYGSRKVGTGEDERIGTKAKLRGGLEALEDLLNLDMKSVPALDLHMVIREVGRRVSVDVCP